MVYLARILAIIATLAAFPAYAQGLIGSDKVLGRDTAGTGQVEQLSVGGAISFTGSKGITVLPADILSNLLTVDGAGSGLDADLLDGFSSAAFQLALTNYVATVADGTGIDGTASGAGSTYTPSLDLTEVTEGTGIDLLATTISLDLTELSTATFGAGAFTTMTFDAGASDPRFETASGSITIDIGGTDEFILNATNLTPGADDGNALGSASVRWADAFLADGGVIDLGASGSRATITHVAASDSLTFAADPDNATASSQFTWSVDNTNELQLDGTALFPGANDGSALGKSGTAWADLWLASGGLIEFDGGTTNTFTCTAGDCTIEGNAIVRSGTTAGGDLTGTYPSPTITTNAVALATDTTGAYVADLTAGTYIDVSGGGAENATVTVDVDATEIEAVTFGAGGNASNVWTFNLSGTDPNVTWGSASATFEAIGAFQRADAANAGGQIRLLEDPGTGTNFIAFLAPAAITSDVTCTLENDANPIPDSCVGDGSDSGGSISDADYGDITVSSSGTVWDIDADTVTPTELAEAGNYSFTGTVTFDADAIHILDTNASHDLIITPGSDLTADRVLTLTTGDAARTLTLTDDVSLGDADKGDITVSSDFTAFAIDANVVQAAEIDETDTYVWSGNSTVTGSLTFDSDAVHIFDTNASHDLIITPGSDLTADRVLTLTTGDAARTITLSGDPTLADWFDQSVKQAATPTFADVTTSDDVFVGDDLSLTSDGAIINIGAANDCVITHSANTLTLTSCTAVGFGSTPPDADYGDITVSSGGTVWDIDADTVTPTELAEAGDYSFTGTVTFDNDALHIFDSDATHDLIITPGSNLTADRVLTITTGDAARTLTLTDDVSLGDADKGDITVSSDFTAFAIDANVVQAAEIDETDTYAWSGNSTVTGSLTFDADAVHIFDTNASHDLIITPGSDLTADRVLTLTTGDAARTLTLTDDVSLGDADKGDITVSSDFTVFAIDANVVQAAEIDETDTYAWSGNSTVTGSLTFDSDAVHIFDTNASHDLIITPGSDLTADRVFTITTGDAARTLTISANATLNDADYGDITTSSSFTAWNIDNNVIGTAELDETASYAWSGNNTETGSVTFDSDALHIFDTNASHDLIITPGSDLTADRVLTLTTGDAARTVTISGNATISQDYSSTGSPTFAAPTVTTLELGAAATDTTFARTAAGEATIEGDAIKHAGKQMFWVGAGAMKASALNPASCGDAYDSGSNDVSIYVCAFDTGGTEENAEFGFAMPKASNESTITMQFAWTNTGGASTETVQWKIACTGFGDDDALNTAYPADVTVSDTWTAQNDYQLTSETGAITIQNLAENDWVNCRIGRDTSVDNMAGDALLIGAKVYWTDNASTLAE